MEANIGPYELNTIYAGDARMLAEQIPDESIDLVFTDPPYLREYMSLYSWLAETAARVLKPGGLCLTLCGHYQVPQVIEMMGEYLSFYWIGGMLHTPGTIARMNSTKMLCGWKPLLWWLNGKPMQVGKRWTFDLFRVKSYDKRYHKWGQAVDYATYYINTLTELGDIVFDPFVGGGTTAAATVQTHRNYLAFEIDSDTAALARERVRNTQPPLLVPQPEQLGLL